ncbi:polynucleotide 5'-hydroxyl-kinase nol9 [Ischnura elegans]|uniref:polynucleotide 5'-hydroxyl-kinase nol9 n=1 Tax=Ischnura elegans TaxID=197161 RepID=UPI001ED8849A|nr:polynucleotide 5'-hydroxyl-kinase nol9 [Ischnura elegans]
MEVFRVSKRVSDSKRRKTITSVNDKVIQMKAKVMREGWVVSGSTPRISSNSGKKNRASFSGTEGWKVVGVSVDSEHSRNGVKRQLVAEKAQLHVMSDEVIISESKLPSLKYEPESLNDLTLDNVVAIGDAERKSSGAFFKASVDNHYGSTEFHHVSGKCYFLILRYPSRLHFRGVISITPVIGSTSFLGFEFPCNAKSYLLFSPKGTSPLFLQSVGRINKGDFESLPKIPGIGASVLDRVGLQDSAILIEPACGEQWEMLVGSFSRILNFNPLIPIVKENKRKPPELDVEANLKVEFVQPEDSVAYSRFHDENSEWYQLSDSVLNIEGDKDPFRLMVFGGKGVGKSTFMRYMVNRWLSKNQARTQSELLNSRKRALLYVDFDPGQSEFMPPGCISATLITEPLLGPNYTHLKDPERAFCIGDLNVEKCPDWYLKCAVELLKFCHSDPALHDIPWFINTMGFCRGIGADLAVKLVQLCHPTHVIQITSRFSRRNFDPIDLLSWNSVSVWKGMDWNPSISNIKGCVVPKYFYHHLWSLAERSAAEEVAQTAAENGTQSATFQDSEEIEDIDSEWGLPASQCRDLCTLAYFSRMVSGPKYSVLQPTPHMIKLSDLTLSIPSPLLKPQMITTAFNARLVALCDFESCREKTVQEIHMSEEDASEVNHNAIPEREKLPWERVLKPNNSLHPRVLFHMPLAPCLGFGIVRAIDNVGHRLFLTTPLGKDVLASVNLLATSPSIGSLPKALYLEPLKGNLKRKRSIPYILSCQKHSILNRPGPRVFNFPNKILPGNKT